MSCVFIQQVARARLACVDLAGPEVGIYEIETRVWGPSCELLQLSVGTVP